MPRRRDVDVDGDAASTRTRRRRAPHRHGAGARPPLGGHPLRRARVGWSACFSRSTPRRARVSPSSIGPATGDCVPRRDRHRRHHAARRGHRRLHQRRARGVRHRRRDRSRASPRAWGPGRSPASASASPPRTPSRSASAGPFVPVVSHDAIAWSRYRPATPARCRSSPMRVDASSPSPSTTGSTTTGCPCASTAPGSRRATRCRRHGASASTRRSSRPARSACSPSSRSPPGDCRSPTDEPLYLRAPDVTPSAGKRVLR